MIKKIKLIASKNLSDVTRLVSHLKKMNIEVYLEDKELAPIFAAKGDNLKEFDLIIILGGDGLFLRSITDLLKSFSLNSPILGINGGNRGALAGFEFDEFLNLDLNNLTFLSLPIWQVQVSGNKQHELLFINETVLSRGNPSRKIFLDVNLGKTSYKVSGDGLIVATASGSSAYAYEAGGSIIDVSLPVLELVSISRNNPKSVIIKEDFPISIEINAKNNPIYLTVDGKEVVAIDYRDKITFKKFQEIKVVKNISKESISVIEKLL